MDHSFWEGKRVLVTGHTGFKGTWMVQLLNALGAVVFGYAKEPDTHFYKNAMGQVEKEFFGDINEQEKLEQFMQQVQPEILIHLASHSTVDKSNEKNAYIFQTNVMGVVHLMECVRKTASVKVVLVVTSDKCYQNKENGIPYEEQDALGAQDAYSTSKACQELVTESYRKTCFSGGEKQVAVATARASNVLGGGDYHYDRLVPSLIQGMLEDGKAKIRNGSARRPWQYVLDALGGYLILCKKMYEYPEAFQAEAAFNFGPEPSGMVSVREIAELIAQEFDDAKIEEIESQSEVMETKTLLLSNRKAKEQLLWKPVYSIDEILKNVTAFAKEEREGVFCGALCQQRVAEYLKRCDLYGVKIL